VIAADQVDLHIGVILGEVGDRHFGGDDRAGSADIGIEARHVAEHADLHIDLLSVGRAASERGGEHRQP